MTGEELKSRRLALGLTQVQLADKLEVSANTIARWERGVMSMPGMTDLALKALEGQGKKKAKRRAKKVEKK